MGTFLYIVSMQKRQNNLKKYFKASFEFCNGLREQPHRVIDILTGRIEFHV